MIMMQWRGEGWGVEIFTIDLVLMPFNIDTKRNILTQFFTTSSNHCLELYNNMIVNTIFVNELNEIKF